MSRHKQLEKLIIFITLNILVIQLLQIPNFCASHHLAWGQYPIIKESNEQAKNMVKEKEIISSNRNWL